MDINQSITYSDTNDLKRKVVSRDHGGEFKYFQLWLQHDAWKSQLTPPQFLWSTPPMEALASL